MPGPNLHSSSYSPAGNTLSGLKAHVKLWEERLGVDIEAFTVLEEVPDDIIRLRLGQGRNIKGWYDSATGRVAVYLPNIVASTDYPESLLDKTLLHEIVGHRGLMNLLGKERFDRYCDNLWEHMSEPLRNRFLRYVSGNERLVSDRRAAAAEFVAHAAEELAEGNTGRWAFAMGELSRVFPHLKQVADMSESKLYDSIGKALRFYNKIRHYNVPNLSPEELDAGLDRKWDSLEGMLRGYVYRDYDDVIKMGRPCQQLLYSSVRARNLPIELRTNALLGSEYDDKQDRHPFSSSDLHGFAKNLANPLAVFYSNNREKPYTTLELIANHTGEGKNRRNFIVPLTPITNKEGFEVMNIDSVYQKEDMTIMYWLSKTYVDRNGNERPSLLRYIGNGFFNEWFTPARERIIKAYEEKIQALEESLERTKPTSKRQSDSAEVGSRLTDLKRDFEEVKDIIARATKVVINFENPKIPEENIRLFYRKDSALSEEVRALKERTIADGSFMKAPDGSPSRLSEDEWLLVHSSAFRQFYGNWEGYVLDEEIRKNGVNSVSLQLLKNLLSYYEETGEDILERIPSEALRSNAERDEKAVAASLLVRADGSSDSSHSLGEQHADLGRQGLRQESTLESWAKGLGVWFDDTDRAFINNNLPDGGFIGEGKEAKVWHGDGGVVTKVISLRNYVSPQHALDRILLHNHHFPEAPLDVIGFGRDSSGAFQIVTRQPFVQGEKMSFSQINSFVRSLGFGPAGHHHDPKERQNALFTTAHTTDDYFLGDLHVANVLLTDSGPAVIDSEMRINTPGLGYGGHYVIPERRQRFDLTEKREPKAFDVQRAALALGLSDDFEHIYFSKTEQIQENGIKMDKPLSFYEGRITPEQNTVFVFGSNPEGRHGAGSARVAAEQFGAEYGKGEGLQGNAYALPTKDLAEARRRGVYSPADSHWKEMTDMVLWYYREDGGGHPYSSLFTGNPYPRSIAPDTIVSSIIELYRTADAHPDKDFKVAYTTAPDDFSLNGYCGGEMAAMFFEAGRRYGKIPENIQFSEKWKELFDEFNIEKTAENKKNNNMSTEQITFTTSLSTGYRQRTIENAEAADLTLAFATDFTTAGERLTRNAAGRKYVAISLTPNMTPQDLAEHIESAINLHYEAEGKERTEIPSISLNIAGNGIFTLSKSGFSQRQVNALFSEAFRIVLSHGYSFSSVRSGGQTGVDEAGVLAATWNGIPATVHTTSDWKWRDANGVDHYGEKGFRDRFVSENPELRLLINDLASEIAVGGDRFSPSDIAPRMRALVLEGQEDIFRDAVRTRYKKIMPAEWLSEEGLAFLEREINIWCSDEQFKLGAAMLNIERDPDDYNNELDAADSFRLVSDGIIAAVFPNAIFPSPSQAKSFEIVLYSKDGARLPAQGFIRSVDNGTGEQIPDFKIEGDVLTANVTVYDGKAGSDPQTEHFHQEVMKVNTETGEMISIEREKSVILPGGSIYEPRPVIPGENEPTTDSLKRTISTATEQAARRIHHEWMINRLSDWFESEEQAALLSKTISNGADDLAIVALAKKEFSSLYEELTSKYPQWKPWDELSSDQKADCYSQANATIDAARQIFGFSLNAGSEGADLAETRISFVNALAKNAHEVWALNKINKGYTFGVIRNDDPAKGALTHPDLIPFEQLSPRESEYDEIVAGAVFDALTESGIAVNNQKTNDMPNKIENPEAAGKNRLRAGLYTLGLGNRSWAEFKSMLPAATTVVVDMRHYTTNPSAPHFNLSSIRKGLTDSGITYEWRPELSGVPSAAGEHLGDGKARKSVRPSVEAVTSPDSRDVVDYDRYAATPEFRLGYEAVKNYINEGKCVVVISGESDPVRSARVKLLGQALLRDGYDAVHLDSERASRGVQGAIRQRRQEEAVAAAMHGSTLLEGDYRQIGFLSNGSFKAAPGAVVRRKDVSSAAEKRMINDVALDNYQKPVSFTEDRESNPFNVSKHNAQDADFSIVFTARRPGYTLRAVTDAVGRGDRARVYIPEHREDLFDEANIAHQAERIADRIAWHLAAHPERAAEGLLINVAGSDLPHINIREVEGQVSAKEIDNPGGEEEQERGRSQRVPAGYKLDDIAGITQEDMNEFVYRVLSKVNGHGIGGPKGEEGGFRIKIDGILTDGNTGVAEAGTIAAQRMGIDPRVNAPKGWGLTYDDESLKGRRVNDEAMFKNRFRQGLAERTVLSEEEIRVRAEQQEFARREENDGFKTGLTDMQVLTLHFLGYPNHHIVDMVDIADRNDVIIDSPESFLEFLEQCEGYGIMGADRLDATKIRDTAAYSANLVRRSLEKGITLTTIVSPDYPSGLRNMADYDVAEAVPAYVVKNGVLSASMEGSKYRETRPAILWRQGDASLTERASVAMIGGGRWSDGAAGRIAAQLGKGLAEQDVALVANRFEGPQREGIEAALAAGGKVVYLTEDPIQKEEPAERDAESIRLGKVGDAPVDRNADLHKKIVENGGVVFSEKSIDEKPGEKKKRRAERVATSLGAAAAVIDDVNKLNPEALGEVATYTTAGLFFGVSSLVKHLFGKQPDAELDENGAGIDELADAAKGVSQQERLEEGLEATNPAIVANEIGDLYPEYHTVPMIVSPEGQRVLFISQRYPDVIKALKEKYGEDIRFADPKNYNTVLQRMKTRTVDYDGGSISLLDDESLSGTRPQVEAPRETRVHFVKGDIYGTATAPDGVPGLASAGMRASDYALFQRFREEALRIEGGLLAAVGMEGRHALKFANAYYPVIGKDKVEVWHGDDLAAVVGLGPDGTLRVTDPTGDFFGMEKPYLSQKNFEKMTARMEEWILKEGPVRSEDYSLATREEREDLDKPYDGPDEYDNVSETLRESNIDVAIRDVNAAIEKKTLLEGNGKPFEKERAVALLLKERAELEKRIADSAEKIAVQRSRVDTLQLQYDNALNSAASGDQLFVAEEELKTAKSGLGDLLAERERMEAARGMNILHTGAIAFAGKVTREDAGSSKTVSLCVDGNRVDIAAAKLTEEEKAAGKAELEALAQGRRSAEEQVLGSMTFLNSETREVEVKLVKPEEQSLAEAKKKAELSEVVGNLVNGYYTVSRDGKMAYANSKLNIVSDWYDKVEPFGLSCGFAYRDGKLNILKGEGLSPALPVWLDGIGAPVDGISLVRSGDLYNYLDLETGEFLLLKWKQEAFDFKNGWGVFKQGPEDYVDGKYNYINRNGEMLNDQGYDRCDDFEDGLATVISNGEAHRVDTEGNDLGTIKLEIDDKAAEERVQDGRGLTLRGPFGSGSSSGK